MRVAVLFLVLLAFGASSAQAASDKRYLNQEYEKAPGPMAYPPGQEPEWLPRLLKKLAAAHSSRRLDEHVLFRDMGGPQFLVTVWRRDLGAKNLLEIHRIEPHPDRDPGARFVAGYSARWFSILVPTGHDVYGDGVPHLFVNIASGGSFTAADGVLIFRLGDKTTDVTPTRYGHVTTAGLVPGEDSRLFLITADLYDFYNYGMCGGCYVSPRAFVIWRDGRYEPACRSHPEIYRASMDNWREIEPDADDEPMAFFAPRLGWAWSAAQIGQVDAANREVEKAIEIARDRGADWAGWRANRMIDAEEFDAFVGRIGDEFLPLLHAAKRYGNDACPLTAAQKGTAKVNPDMFGYKPIARTPNLDVP